MPRKPLLLVKIPSSNSMTVLSVIAIDACVSRCAVSIRSNWVRGIGCSMMNVYPSYCFAIVRVILSKH
ncbi:hypothetical protein D3C72_2179520 [compost metagenome]